MRNWITLFEKREVISVLGRDVTVWKNPRYPELFSALQHAVHNVCRGVYGHDDNLYVWSAADAIHMHVTAVLSDPPLKGEPLVFGLDRNLLVRESDWSDGQVFACRDILVMKPDDNDVVVQPLAAKLGWGEANLIGRLEVVDTGEVDILPLREHFETSFNNRGKSCEVFKNPTRKELLQCKEYDSVRAFVVDDDLYVWNPFRALHQEIRDQLNLPPDAISIEITFVGRSAAVMVTDNTKNTIWHHNPKVVPELSNNSRLRQLFNNIHIDFYDSAIVGNWRDIMPH